MSFNIVVGLEKPEVAPTTRDEMRRAIRLGRRDSSLIANVLSGAEFNGLSGEDTYVMLAYHALRMLEDSWQRELRGLERMPAPPFFIKKG